MNKILLFGAMATGGEITVHDSGTRKHFTGIIVSISLESGAVDGKQPNAFIVKMVSDDDMVDLFVRTID